MNTIDVLISDIIYAWNPLDVPDHIIESEYMSYVIELLKIGADREGVYQYLKEMFLQKMGLTWSDLAEKDLRELSDQIVQCYQKR